MKNHVRAGGAGMRGGKSPAARHVSAASLLVLLSAAALASSALADDVSVNWEALGEPALSNERIILRNPGEKETLPLIRLQPPASLKDAPTPLAKPVIIPESAAKAPAPAEKPAVAAAPEPEASKPEISKAAATPEPKPETAVEAATDTAPEAETVAEADTEVKAGDDGTFHVALPSTAAPGEAAGPETAAAPENVPAAPTSQAENASGEQAAEQKLVALSPPEPAFARVLFDEDSTTILSAARAELDAAASRLQQNSERVQLKAYGGDPGDISSEARKLSLRRALAVYNYLRDQGVLTSRMDVRAFGGTRDAGPTERVDIVVQDR